MILRFIEKHLVNKITYFKHFRKKCQNNYYLFSNENKAS
jgi:hypothetical protein